MHVRTYMHASSSNDNDDNNNAEYSALNGKIENRKIKNDLKEVESSQKREEAQEWPRKWYVLLVSTEL